MRPTDELQSRLAAVWRSVEDTTLGRVAKLEATAGILAKRPLAEEERAAAEREAHQLRGILGTFGFQEGSRLAVEIDQIIRAPGTLEANHGRAIAERAAALRESLFA